MDKLRGKKRHPAKPAKPTVDASPSRIDISYETLSKLGKAIANTHKVEVDYSVLVVLKGIIHARKGFAT